VEESRGATGRAMEVIVAQLSSAGA